MGKPIWKPKDSMVTRLFRIKNQDNLGQWIDIEIQTINLDKDLYKFTLDKSTTLFSYVYDYLIASETEQYYNSDDDSVVLDGEIPISSPSYVIKLPNREFYLTLRMKPSQIMYNNGFRSVVFHGKITF